jgi:hypothetical protein
MKSSNNEEDTKQKINNLQSLHHLLNPQSSKLLNGRQVKVPLTSKAFFEGTLEPTVANTKEKNYTSNDGNKCNNVNEEHVLMNLGSGYMAEMNRNEACDYIQKKINALKPLLGEVSSKSSSTNTKIDASASTSTKMNPNEKKSNKKLQMKKGFLNREKRSSKKEKTKAAVSEPVSALKSGKFSHTPQSAGGGATFDNTQIASRTNSSGINAHTHTHTHTPILPYMEIREEYDKDGKEIKAEALNVSTELMGLQRELKAKKSQIDNATTTPGEEKGEKQEKTEIVDALLDNLHQMNDGFDDETSSDQHSAHNYSGTHADADADVLTKIEKEKEINKQKKEKFDYQEISSRLDKLMLLEEEEEKKKTQNTKSSKRLCGKGWAKGFLDSKSSSTSSSAKAAVIKEKAVKTLPSKDKITAKKKEEAKIFQNNNNSDQINEREVSLQESTPSSRKVQFKASNQVKQIPRIGSRSIPSANKNFNNSFNTNQNIVEKSRTSRRETVPIGGVIERGQTQMPQSVVNNEEKVESTQQPQKKLSKFAQRRLQQRR